jgi:hypothetical protein
MMTARKPGVEFLSARYPDLETRNFLGRVASALHRAAPEDNRSIIGAFRARCQGLRPGAFRIVPGPHEGWAPHVAVVVVYLPASNGRPPLADLERYLRLGWALDATETHELSLVMVDEVGHETPLAMTDLLIEYDRVHGDPPPDFRAG